MTVTDLWDWLLARAEKTGPLWANAVAVAAGGGLLVSITPHSPELRYWQAFELIGVPLVGACVFTALGRLSERPRWASVVRYGIAAYLAYVLVGMVINLGPLGHGFFTVLVPDLYPWGLGAYGVLLLVGLGLTARSLARGNMGISPLLPGRWHLSLLAAGATVAASAIMVSLFFPHDARLCRGYEEQPGLQLLIGSGELMATRRLDGRASVYQVIYAADTGTLYASFKHWTGFFFSNSPGDAGSAVIARRADGSVSVVPFPDDEAPEYLAYDALTRTLYVSAFRTTGLSRLHSYEDDGAKLIERGAVELPEFETTQAGAVAVDTEHRRLLLWDDNTTLLRFDIGSAGELTALDGRRLVPERMLWVWDFVQTTPSAGVLTGLSWPDTRYDSESGVVTALQEGTGAIGGGYDGTTDRLAVADIVEGAVRLYDGAGTFIRRLDAHSHPRDATPLGSRGWVAAGDYPTGRIVILDASDGRVVATREAGGPLRTLVYDGSDLLYAGTSCGLFALDLREVGQAGPASERQAD